MTLIIFFLSTESEKFVQIFKNYFKKLKKKLYLIKLIEIKKIIHILFIQEKTIDLNLEKK